MKGGCPTPAETLELEGRVWFRDALASEDLAVFDAATDLDACGGQRLTPDPGLTRVLAPCGGVGRLIAALGEGLIPVRVVAFNKSVDANWLVPWHQDRVITVAQRTTFPVFETGHPRAGSGTANLRSSYWLRWSLSACIWTMRARRRARCG